MARSSIRAMTGRKKRGPRRGRPRRGVFRRVAQFGQKWLRTYWAAPAGIKVVVAVLAVVLLWSGTNWLYQVARKPTELYFPVSGALAKPPSETWRRYEPMFRAHATAVMT